MREAEQGRSALHQTPVIIVGGGPVGMTAGLLLARHHVASVVVERRASTARHPKARGFNVRTMEIFRQLGIAERVAAVQPPKDRVRSFALVRNLWDAHMRILPFGIGDLDPTAFSPCTGSVGSQDALERVLHEAVTASPHCQLWNGNEVVDVRQTHDRIIAEFVDEQGARQELSAQWMIAADGARSFVRQRANIALAGKAELSRHINVMFEAELAERMASLNCIFAVVGESGDALSGIPTARHANEWTYNFVLAAHERAQDFDEAACVARIRAALGLPEIPIRVTGIAPWESSAVVAERWRDGRILLAGDAAHLMPPAGGLGMNTGIQDVHNLAWRLALIVSGHAGEALLDDYVDERIDAAWSSVHAAAANLAAAQTAGGISAIWARPQHGLVLGHRYQRGSFIGDKAAHDTPPQDPLAYVPSGDPGGRAPHIWLDPDHGRSTLDLFGDGLMLVCDGESAMWRHAVRTLFLETGIGVGIIALDDAARIMTTSAWREVAGLDRGGALLVRADGIVAWRSRTGSDAPDLAEVINTLLRREPRLG